MKINSLLLATVVCLLQACSKNDKLSETPEEKTDAGESGHPEAADGSGCQHVAMEPDADDVFSVLRDNLKWKGYFKNDNGSKYSVIFNIEKYSIQKNSKGNIVYFAAETVAEQGLVTRGNGKVDVDELFVELTEEIVEEGSGAAEDDGIYQGSLTMGSKDCTKLDLEWQGGPTSSIKGHLILQPDS